MSKPLFLFDNRFSDSAVRASSTAAGYAVANVTDWRPYTWWKAAAAAATLTVNCGAAASADYGLIIGHNLGSQGATIDWQSSADGSSWTTRGTESPTDDGHLLTVFASVSAQYWRASISGAPGAAAIDWRFAVDKALPDAVTFTRASTATYFDANGVLRTAAINEPRFDHDPETGQSLGLLIEEARTNLLLNSTLDGANLATQSITTTAAARTISFYGTGTLTLSGAHSASVAGVGPYPQRTTYTYTPTAGSLTVTVSGTVQYAQDELGSFATSFMPTAGTSVTRSADAASVTGANFSGFYNQSAGSALVEFDRQIPAASSVAFDVLSISNNSTTESIILKGGFATPSQQRIDVTDGGVSQASISLATIVAGQRHRIAAAYAANDIAGSFDGGAVLTDTAATLPTVDRMWIGNSASGNQAMIGHISRIAYWPRRLTNTQLQWLTAAERPVFANPTIAIAAVGAKFELPSWLEGPIDMLGRSLKGATNLDSDGQPIGKTWTHQEWRETLQLNSVSRAWVKDTFLPAWRSHLAESPFGFCFEPVNHPDEAMLVIAAGDYAAPQRAGDLVNWSLPVSAVVS